VVQVARGVDRTVWVVPRDEQMLTWFSIVRVANVQTVRWVLGALNGWTSPVSSRQAQSWCSRMKTAGLIDTAQLGGPGGVVVWATYAGVRQAKPDLYRQTTRHEIAVAATSARYAAAGYASQRDDKAALTGGREADGVAARTRRTRRACPRRSTGSGRSSSRRITRACTASPRRPEQPASNGSWRPLPRA
jgi:hypothetical protein